MNYIVSTLLMFFFVSSRASALPLRLDPLLEQEIRAELQALGPDSWEEAGKQINFTEIFFDQSQNLLIIHYRSRSSNKSFAQYLSLKISPILSTKDILEKAPNGAQYLNPKITDAIFNSL
jgi:hypothetical protein